MIINPLMASTMVFVFALWLFGHMVHVARIIETLRMKEGTDLLRYVEEAFAHAEFLTLLSMVLMVWAVGYALVVLTRARIYIGGTMLSV